ncbi:MAG: hypothetical protein U0X76_09275 [Bacteroidia bacterium]
MQFFANFTSTALNSPSFTPVQELKSLYLPALHAHTFGAGGLKAILSIRNNIDFDTEDMFISPIRNYSKQQINVLNTAR